MVNLYKWIFHRYGAIVENSENFEKPLLNNANHIARILYRLTEYRCLSWHRLCHGVPIQDIILSEFPLIAPCHLAPAIVTFEFTNHCNLQCVYCDNRLNLRPKGFMHRDTFVNVVAGIKKLGVKRVRVVGNGEATLHPDFDSFMTEIGSTNAYVSVLTNGQWRHQEDTINTMLTAKVNMVEFSVDTVTKKGYERSRQGGSFERLLSNLQHFKEAKKKQRSQVITNIRLMLRPSERRIEWKLKAFWSNYADIVMPQYLCEKRSISYNEDLYRPIQFNEQSYPNCKEPFTQLGITWNGDVPLCSLSADQIGEPGLILGNVTSSTIGQLWNSKVLHQYRRGHRNRETSKMAMCKGCVGM